MRRDSHNGARCGFTGTPRTLDVFATMVAAASTVVFDNPLESFDSEAPKPVYASPWSDKDEIKRAKLSEVAAREYLLGVQNQLGGAGKGKHTTARMFAAATTIQKHVRGALARAWMKAQREADHLRELAHLKEFSIKELMTLATSCITPLIDALSDFGVMVEWAHAGPDYRPLLWGSVAIHVIAGTVSGLLFTVRPLAVPTHVSFGPAVAQTHTAHAHRAYLWYAQHFNSRRKKRVDADYVGVAHSSNPCMGLILGLAGLISPVQAYLAVVDANSVMIKDVVARDDLTHLGWFKTLELLLEHVPQLCLQTFVGIAYGDLVSFVSSAT